MFSQGLKTIWMVPKALALFMHKIQGNVLEENDNT